MPLPLPSLDNRTFDELVAEGRSLLPRHAPGWTDHNFHDPGVTLLELFAWLIETDIYRLDRTLEASYRAFLRLVGVEVQPAQVADSVVVFSLDKAVQLPAGLQIGDAAGMVVFQTTSAVNVSPAQLQAVLTVEDKIWFERTTENQIVGRRYQPFGSQPAPGDALYLGFDRPLADQPVEMSLHVWSGSTAADRQTRQQLIAEWQAATDEAKALCPAAVELAVPGWWLHYGVRTVWEYHATAGDWLPLAGVADETRGLTLSGPVRFLAPADPAPGGPDNDRFYIRCRLVSGHYDCPPVIDGIALNAVSAGHAADSDGEYLLGISNGRAGQRFPVNSFPVVPGSTRLRLVLNNVEDDPWEELLFWDLAGPHDRVYLLSPEQGLITTGDGRLGRVPPAGAELWLKHQVGGGPAGNVAADTLTMALAGAPNVNLVADWTTVQPALMVSQPYEALGGAPAESLYETKGRALSTLAEQRRVVTLADFETLTQAMPGVPVARARALADYHPAVPCYPALGNVTVVVVPDCPESNSRPGPDLLRAVASYLDRRRTLTAELHVIGPTYTPVAVYARLHTDPDIKAGQLTALAHVTLNTFFHPLHGGPEGQGWPVGRDVYRAEVMALLSALPGVVFVDQLGLRTKGDLAPRCGNLPVCPDSLLSPGEHVIEVITRSRAK